MGEEDLSAAKKVLANCFLMLLVFSVLLIGGILPFREPMLRLFGASDATYPLPRSTLPPTCAAPSSPWRPAA